MLVVYAATEGEIRSRDKRAEEHIERMSRGDVSAMGELYELIKTDVYAYALSKTASKDDAEDIVHDTFVQVWRNATLYKPLGKPLAWVFTIEMNLIRREFNKKQRIVPLEEAIELEADGGDFSEKVIDNEFLRQILTVLNEEEREVISLHIVSGLKHREIARIFGKPLSTVLSRYNRAIKKLQLRIADKED